MNGGQMFFRGVKSASMALAFLAVACFPAQAQSPVEDRYLVSTLSMESGLPCNYVDDVCRDSAGFLWLATSGGGLCRFDGYELLSFGSTSSVPLRSNFIRSICEDGFHRLWIASWTLGRWPAWTCRIQTWKPLETSHVPSWPRTRRDTFGSNPGHGSSGFVSTRMAASTTC